MTAIARAIQMHLGRVHGGDCLKECLERDRGLAEPLGYLCLGPAASTSSISKDEDGSKSCDSWSEFEGPSEYILQCQRSNSTAPWRCPVPLLLHLRHPVSEAERQGLGRLAVRGQ